MQRPGRGASDTRERIDEERKQRDVLRSVRALMQGGFVAGIGWVAYLIAREHGRNPKPPDWGGD